MFLLRCHGPINLGSLGSLATHFLIPRIRSLGTQGRSSIGLNSATILSSTLTSDCSAAPFVHIRIQKWLANGTDKHALSTDFAVAAQQHTYKSFEAGSPHCHDPPHPVGLGVSHLVLVSQYSVSLVPNESTQNLCPK